jgi:hypothetical protein
MRQITRVGAVLIGGALVGLKKLKTLRMSENQIGNEGAQVRKLCVIVKMYVCVSVCMCTHLGMRMHVCVYAHEYKHACMHYTNICTHAIRHRAQNKFPQHHVHT